MSFQSYLKNGNSFSYNRQVSDLEGRNPEDYFFNKSDREKVVHYDELIKNYKLCDKKYFYFNSGFNIWKEELTNDHFITRICEHSHYILEAEEKHVFKIIGDKIKILIEKQKKNTINTREENEIKELNTAFKEFEAFIKKAYKTHNTQQYAKRMINFIHDKIIDDGFTSKININNHHLLPFIEGNLNLKTLQIEPRTRKQNFTKFLNFTNFKGMKTTDENYIKVNNFFLDIATGYQPKLDYIQKTLGYFVSGAVPFGRCMHIFYGSGRNGKSALMEILKEIMGDYLASVESSIIIKKGKKSEGAASPEIGVLNFGLRLAQLSETDEGDELNETLIKNISGYDMISYRPLYCEPKNFRSEAKLCMLTNNKPVFKFSQSMIDRIRFISFNSQFITEQEKNQQKGILKNNQYLINQALVQELKTTLKDYVLFWIVQGSKKFFEDEHLNIPDDEKLLNENKTYINDMDSFGRFVSDCLEIDKTEEERTRPEIVYNIFKNYCNNEGLPVIKPRKFRELILEKFNAKKSSLSYYIGFKIKEDDEEKPEEKPEEKKNKKQKIKIEDEEEYTPPDPQGLDS